LEFQGNNDQASGNDEIVEAIKSLEKIWRAENYNSSDITYTWDIDAGEGNEVAAKFRAAKS